MIPLLASPPCVFVKTPNNTAIEQLISGTYCHPDLVPSIAGWISPIFQIMANRVVNGYITNEYKHKLNVMQLQLEQSKELELKHRQATVKAEEELANQQIQLDELSLLELEHRRASIIAELLQLDAEEDAQKKEHRIRTWANSHAFTMMRLNNPNAKLPYYAIRRKRINMSGATMKLRGKHPHSIMIYQNSHVPNPINLYNRLKSCGLLHFKGNYCQSLVGEAELISKLGELYTIIE